MNKPTNADMAEMINNTGAKRSLIRALCAKDMSPEMIAAYEKRRADLIKCLAFGESNAITGEELLKRSGAKNMRDLERWIAVVNNGKLKIEHSVRGYYLKDLVKAGAVETR